MTSLQVTLAMGTAELQGLTIGAAAPASSAAAEGAPAAAQQPSGTAAGAASAAQPSKQQAGGRSSRPPSAASVPAAAAAAAVVAQHPLQLASGPYLLLFTSPGVARAQLLVNLLVVKPGAAKPPKG